MAFNLYHTKKIDENKNDNRKGWNTLDEIMCTKKSRGNKIEISSLTNENEQESTNPIDMANTLNKHFNAVGGKMASKVNPMNRKVKDPLVYINNSPLQSIYLYPTTIQEITKIIAEINSNKATGPDNIPGYMPKITSQTIAPVIAN